MIDHEGNADSITSYEIEGAFEIATIHNGHIDIATRASKLFDELEFVVAVNTDKTPLFSIKGYIETLEDGAIYDNKVNKVFLKKMYNQTENLETLFNNLNHTKTFFPNILKPNQSLKTIKINPII